MNHLFIGDYPEYIVQAHKLYQLAIKRLHENKQAMLMEKITIPILETVYGKVLKAKQIENIEEYYIASLANFLSENSRYSKI